MFPDEDLILEYTEGDCMFLALALHEDYGFELHAFERFGSVDHVFVVVQGRALDIEGFKTIKAMRSKWQTYKECNYRPNLTRDEMLELVWGLTPNQLESSLVRARQVVRDYMEPNFGPLERRCAS